MGKKRNFKVNPNSLKNLIPAKKGEVKNPLGGHSHDPYKRALKKLTEERFQEVISLALQGDLSALEAYYKNPDSPALQAGVAQVVYKACKEGDWSMIKTILESIIGTKPIEINHSGSIGLQVFKSRDQLEQEIKQLTEKQAELSKYTEIKDVTPSTDPVRED